MSNKEIPVNSGAHFTGTGTEPESKKHTGIPVTGTGTGIPVGPYPGIADFMLKL